MPLSLVHKRNKKTKNIYIRGTYLGTAVDQSSRTDRGSVARRIRDNIERAIERGEYPSRELPPQPNEPTFLSAAIAYLESGDRSRKTRRAVARLIKHFGETPLAQIGQAEIDEAAIKLCPNVTAGTRNAAVYTPASAILHNAKVPTKIKRPKGAKGRVVTDWLSEADADAVILAGNDINQEFGLLLRFLLYTGLRLNEALKLRWDDMQLEEEAWVRRSKGGVASPVRLRPKLVAGLLAHRPQEALGRVFRFHAGGHLKHLLTRAKLAALGLPCPTRRPTGWQPPPNRLAWCNFHTFRHTWATWMRRYAGADVKDLVATNNWRDERSAARYSHAVARESWGKVDLLPEVGILRGVRSA